MIGTAVEDALVASFDAGYDLGKRWAALWLLAESQRRYDPSLVSLADDMKAAASVRRGAKCTDSE